MKFYSGCCYVGETPRIIDKMTNFWRLVFASIIWLLATLCNTLIRIREKHCFLRVILSFSESASENESVFWICVWIIIDGIGWFSMIRKYFFRFLVPQSQHWENQVLFCHICYIDTEHIRRNNTPIKSNLIFRHCNLKLSTLMVYIYILHNTFISLGNLTPSPRLR